MSFNHEIENNIRSNDKDHLPMNLVGEIHQHMNKWKASQNIILPPINKFGGLMRQKPATGINPANLISGQGSIDFHLGSSGYVEKLILELELTCANPTTIIPHYLIDRIEYLSTEGNIMSTIYGDNVYAVKLHKTLEQHNREKSFENLDSSYNGVSVAANTLTRFELHLPCFIDATQVKLSSVKDRVIIRIYFSSNGVTVGAASDVSVSLCDLIQITQQLSGAHESMEQKRKQGSSQWFRFLNPVRAVTQTLAMAASNQYDIRLTSANGMSAYLFFVVRANPLSGANINTFLAIDSFELQDRTGTIVGIKQNVHLNKVMGMAFDGDILNFKNFYVLPFSISIDSSNNGQQTGFYKFTGDEILRIYTTSTFASGSYRVDVYSYDYNKLMVEHGRIDVQK